MPTLLLLVVLQASISGQNYITSSTNMANASAWSAIPPNMTCGKADPWGGTTACTFVGSADFLRQGPIGAKGNPLISIAGHTYEFCWNTQSQLDPGSSNVEFSLCEGMAAGQYVGGVICKIGATAWGSDWTSSNCYPNTPGTALWSRNCVSYTANSSGNGFSVAGWYQGIIQNKSICCLSVQDITGYDHGGSYNPTNGTTPLIGSFRSQLSCNLVPSLWANGAGTNATAITQTTDHLGGNGAIRISTSVNTGYWYFVPCTDTPCLGTHNDYGPYIMDFWAKASGTHAATVEICDGAANGGIDCVNGANNFVPTTAWTHYILTRTAFPQNILITPDTYGVSTGQTLTIDSLSVSRGRSSSTGRSSSPNRGAVTR